MSKPGLAFLSTGSNLGNREQNLASALAALSDFISVYGGFEHLRDRALGLRRPARLPQPGDRGHIAPRSAVHPCADQAHRDRAGTQTHLPLRSRA